jgi:hypothetical protein
MSQKLSGSYTDVSTGGCMTFAAVCDSVSMTLATVLPRSSLQSQVGRICSVICYLLLMVVTVTRVTALLPKSHCARLCQVAIGACADAPRKEVCDPTMRIQCNSKSAIDTRLHYRPDLSECCLHTGLPPLIGQVDSMALPSIYTTCCGLHTSTSHDPRAACLTSRLSLNHTGASASSGAAQSRAPAGPLSRVKGHTELSQSGGSAKLTLAGAAAVPCIQRMSKEVQC